MTSTSTLNREARTTVKSTLYRTKTVTRGVAATKTSIAGTSQIVVTSTSTPAATTITTTVAADPVTTVVTSPTATSTILQCAGRIPTTDKIEMTGLFGGMSSNVPMVDETKCCLYCFKSQTCNGWWYGGGKCTVFLGLGPALAGTVGNVCPYGRRSPRFVPGAGTADGVGGPGPCAGPAVWDPIPTVVP